MEGVVLDASNVLAVTLLLMTLTVGATIFLRIGGISAPGWVVQFSEYGLLWIPLLGATIPGLMLGVFFALRGAPLPALQPRHDARDPRRNPQRGGDGMESVSIMMVCMPIFMPICKIAGFDDEIGIRTIVRAAVPYILFDLLVMALIVAFPQIVLWLAAKGG
jgi:hypothetical protein